MVEQACGHCGSNYSLSSTQRRVGSKFCSAACKYAAMRLSPRVSLADRFWAKVDVRGPTQCWEWQAGCFADGYGAISVNSSPKRASRVSYFLAHGSIDDDLCILHQCDNKKCVNPLHLRLGTHAENMAEMAARGRSGNTRKLTDQQVLDIRDATGKTLVELADQYNVSVGLISLIRGKLGYRVGRPTALSTRKERALLKKLCGKP